MVKGNELIQQKAEVAHIIGNRRVMLLVEGIVDDRWVTKVHQTRVKELGDEARLGRCSRGEQHASSPNVPGNKKREIY